MKLLNASGSFLQLRLAFTPEFLAAVETLYLWLLPLDPGYSLGREKGVLANSPPRILRKDFF